MSGAVGAVDSVHAASSAISDAAAILELMFTFSIEGFFSRPL